jgi:L-ascorbate metabolism protein UlaG (beta-lactamase superfamily)
MTAVLVASLAFAGAFGTPAPAPGGELRATFIGNMAFHITDGRVAILTDFPYESLVPRGPTPLCVISHSHADHFAPRLARDFCGSILGPRDVVAGSGVRALELGEEVRWEGISIRPVPTPHAGLEHYSYLLEWGDRRIYLTGDTEDTTELLAARDLDVAFVSPWLLSAVEAQGRKIDAAQVVVYHHTTDEDVPHVQGRLVPWQGQVLGLASGEVRVIEDGPEEPPETADEDVFQKRPREARGNVQIPAGRAYFEGAFSKQFYPTYAPRLSECTEQAEGTAPESFDLVLALGADGRIREAMVRPETRLASCFVALVKKDVFPLPPSEGFPVPVSMRFTRE